MPKTHILNYMIPKYSLNNNGYLICHKDKIVRITFSIQFQINKVLQEEIKLTLREKQL